MNREIKFRALKDDMANCVFMYGQLVYDAIGTPRITAVDKSGDGLTFHTCLKDTEGQYTGLKDKNGVEIYEGDKMKRDIHHTETGEVIGDQKASVIFENAEFKLLWYDRAKTSLYRLYSGFEVIGNIHQIP